MLNIENLVINLKKIIIEIEALKILPTAAMESWERIKKKIDELINQISTDKIDLLKSDNVDAFNEIYRDQEELKNIAISITSLQRREEIYRHMNVCAAKYKIHYDQLERNDKTSFFGHLPRCNGNIDTNLKMEKLLVKNNLNLYQGGTVDDVIQASLNILDYYAIELINNERELINRLFNISRIKEGDLNKISYETCDIVKEIMRLIDDLARQCEKRKEIYILLKSMKVNIDRDFATLTVCDISTEHSAIFNKGLRP